MQRFGSYLRKTYVDEYNLPPKETTEEKPPDERNNSANGAGIRLFHASQAIVPANNLDDIPNNRHRPILSLPRITARDTIDPYRYRWLAMTIHCFLTKVCRMTKRVAPCDSTSTISFPSHTISSLPTNNTSQNTLSSIATSEISSKNSSNKRSSPAVPAVRLQSVDTIQEQEATTSSHQDFLTVPPTVPVVHRHSIGEGARRSYDTKKNKHPMMTRTTEQPASIVSSLSTTESSLQSRHGSLELKAHPCSRHSSKDTSSSDPSLLRLARHSKKLGRTMRHRYDHFTGHTTSVRQVPTSPLSSPRPSSQMSTSPSTSRASSISLPIKQKSPSTASLSAISSRHSTDNLKQGEKDVIDRLSLLSEAGSIERSKKAGYLALCAPPYYYRQRTQQSKPTTSEMETEHILRPRSLSKTAIVATRPSSFGSFESSSPTMKVMAPNDLTIVSKHIQHISSPSSTASTSSSSSSMKLAIPQYHALSNNAVTLTSSSLKVLLDGEQEEPLVMIADGVANGWTTLIHIDQTWHDEETTTDERVLSLVEHWYRDYVGSRWFVV
ncbi:uncharacterized protein BX664DRAFT_324239, partial [Halteromyces radiatus]|uniref:uncharacterized protein n=1 Tax=Halteromyces radiatus TaxID=101107 RepID=UPI0022201DE1